MFILLLWASMHVENSTNKYTNIYMYFIFRKYLIKIYSSDSIYTLFLCSSKFVPVVLWLLVGNIKHIWQVQTKHITKSIEQYEFDYPKKKWLNWDAATY